MIVLPKGVNCTMLTAYTKDNQLDFDAQGRMLEWYAKKGVKSLFAMCHSTELHKLTMEERLAMIRFVRKQATPMAGTGERMPIVAAGTFSNADQLQQMASEVRAVAEAGADAVVMITNRLDPHQEGSDVFRRNAEALLQLIPEDITLGMYECPEPYKRVLTLEEMQWAVDTGRICFLKDTCCDPDMLSARMEIVRGSRLQLFNANAQTLLPTLQQGAAGYSSVMANMHPELYVWLCENYARYPEAAQKLQHVLCFTAFAESLAYPITAKYVMRCQGVPVELNSRMRDAAEFTPYHRVIMDQLMAMTEEVMAQLPV